MKALWRHHVQFLHREFINEWHDHEISPGTYFAAAINSHLVWQRRLVGETTSTIAIEFTDPIPQPWTGVKASWDSSSFGVS